MRRLLALLTPLLVATPAAAQLNLGDTKAVTDLVAKYHAALEAGDTTAVKAMLAPGAIVISRGEVHTFGMAQILGNVRWERAIKRDSVQRTARVTSWSAYVITMSKIASRSNPELLSGTEAESIVLTRLMQTWFIEVVHTSLGSSN